MRKESLNLMLTSHTNQITSHVTISRISLERMKNTSIKTSKIIKTFRYTPTCLLDQTNRSTSSSLTPALRGYGWQMRFAQPANVERKLCSSTTNQLHSSSWNFTQPPLITGMVQSLALMLQTPSAWRRTALWDMVA